MTLMFAGPKVSAKQVTLRALGMKRLKMQVRKESVRRRVVYGSVKILFVVCVTVKVEVAY